MKFSKQSSIPKVILRDACSAQWMAFGGLKKIYSIDSIEEIVSTLSEIESMVREQNLWAAGWVSYEASSAFDDALTTHESSEFPLLWMALFEYCELLDLETPRSELEGNSMSNIHWSSSVQVEAYRDSINKIKHELLAGNSYQVNYTFRQMAKLDAPIEQVFLSFAANARYGALIDTERFSLCSASPELFFEKQGDEIRCRPMKGTAARGRSYDEDIALRDELATSTKNRAENLMILDMIRNDLGKIAKPGSVNTSEVFAIEKYPTVWQMTSTVKASSDASLVETFSALFPCASITGAPKASTMKIIRRLEPGPRNLYTGAIGFIRPDVSMQFNVAIRSLLLDKTTGVAEYGVGGGIVWDSDAGSEFQECQIKARVLSRGAIPAHQLLETFLWEPEQGYFLIDYHLDRLQRSAEYFDYSIDFEKIKKALDGLVESARWPQRVRLLVDKAGKIDVTKFNYVARVPDQPYRLILSDAAIDESNVYLFHKTTERRCYETFAQKHSGFDDVLLVNQQGEVTESLIANLIVEIDGKQYTPPVECGLLAGTYRQYLLDRNLLIERVIDEQILRDADNVYLANSVRKIWKVDLEFNDTWHITP